jgi:mRNA-degrading endonuclease RelE of RelBE toxin-antitoxin system
MASNEKPKYAVIFDRRAKKEFDQLEQGQRKALHEQLELLENDSSPRSSKELEGYAPYRRITAREVRAIYKPPDDRNRIRVLAIGERRTVYDDLAELIKADRAR